MDRQLIKLTGLFMEALFDEDALRPALEAFADFCGAPVSHLMISDGHRTLLQSTFSVDLDESLAATEAEFQNINPRVLAIPKMKAGKATRDKDFISRAAMDRDPTHQELIFPLGLGHFSAVPIVNNRTMTAGIALHRPIDGEPFSDEEACRHEAAAAACAGVFSLARRIQERDVRNALDVFGRNRSVAILDGKAGLVDYNHEFERLCARNEIVIRKGAPLPLLQAPARNSLQRAVRRRVGTVLLKADNCGFPRLLCNIMPLPSIGFSAAGAGTVLAVVHDLGAPDHLDRHSLMKDFGLTQAELETAILLSTGRSTQEISDTRGVSINTTRTLLKRVIAKTGSRGQVDIASLVSLYRL